MTCPIKSIERDPGKALVPFCNKMLQKLIFCNKTRMEFEHVKNYQDFSGQ
jgi:hypothetical protein